jgi:hypothetical protein
MALKKTIKMATTGAVALGLASIATDAHAQSQSVTATVSATVQNAFNFVETTAMNFGTLVALADTAGANTATIQINTAGALSIPTNNAPAQFIIVNSAAATQGVFDITNAAPSTAITLSFANTANLTCAICGGGNPALTLSGLTTDTGLTPNTSAAGALTINVGAQLTTVAGGNQYADGAYAGSFDFTASY